MLYPKKKKKKKEEEEINYGYKTIDKEADEGEINSDESSDLGPEDDEENWKDDVLALEGYAAL